MFKLVCFFFSFYFSAVSLIQTVNSKILGEFHGALEQVGLLMIFIFSILNCFPILCFQILNFFHPLVYISNYNSYFILKCSFQTMCIYFTALLLLNPGFIFCCFSLCNRVLELVWGRIPKWCVFFKELKR